MPRPVVPIRASEFCASRARSSSPCRGRISGRVLGDHQVLGGHRHPLPRQPLDLGQQRPGVQHHAVADHAELARPHDARGQRRQLVGHPVDHQRMAGVVPALKPGDHIGPLAQPVDDLALALVAPLGADDDDVCHAIPRNVQAGPGISGTAQARKAELAAGSGAVALSAGMEDEMNDDQTAIRDLVQRWADATRSGDIGAISGMMTEDALFHVAGRDPFDAEAFRASAEKQRAAGMKIESTRRGAGREGCRRHGVRPDPAGRDDDAAGGRADPPAGVHADDLPARSGPAMAAVARRQPASAAEVIAAAGWTGLRACRRIAPTDRRGTWVSSSGGCSPSCWSR